MTTRDKVWLGLLLALVVAYGALGFATLGRLVADLIWEVLT